MLENKLIRKKAIYSVSIALVILRALRIDALIPQYEFFRQIIYETNYCHTYLKGKL